MKTLKVVEPKKIVTWSLVVMFSFLQIVPTGWAAARPADELEARGVSASVDALANPAVAPKPTPAPQRNVGFVDSTAFQLNGSPLSPVTSEPTPNPVPIPIPVPIPVPTPNPVPIPPEVTAVKADLLRNLGIDAKQLEAWLKDGLITIKYDEMKNTVSVSFSDKLRSQYDGLKNVNFFDPTGASGLPKSIEYHYVSIIDLPTCKAGEVCVQGGRVRIVLDSARITNWDGTFGAAKYTNGELSQVDWYLPPVAMMPCPNDGTPCGILTHTVTFNSIASIPEDPNPAHLLVNVVYHDGRAVSRLEFEIGRLDDEKDHILNIREYGKDGKFLGRSEFKYLVAMTNVICAEGSKCVPPPAVVHLDSIVRTDADGKLLSTIRNIRKADIVILDAGTGSSVMPPIFWGNYAGDVVLADGQIRSVSFKDLSDLLEQARKFEQENSIPPVVQEYIDALKNQFGARFSVTAKLQADGTYLVQVGRANTCQEGTICPSMTIIAPGFFTSMEFSLTQDGALNKDSIKATFAGIEVDGKLLFEAMGALEGSFHPKGSEWMIAPPYYTARLIQLASEIHVKESGENLLGFDHRSNSYKAYRDSTGNVILEQEIPPAVQAYVDQLQQKLGDGFKVSAVYENGSYRVTVTDSKNYFVAPAGGLSKMDFLLREWTACTNSIPGSCVTGFAFDPETLRLTYYGKKGSVEVSQAEAKMLFEGLSGTIITIPEGNRDLAVLQALKEITVTSVEKGVVHFSRDGKVFKCYRDASGKVLVEEDSRIDLPVSAELLAQARLILGSIVATGYYVTRPEGMIVEGGAERFYDADGNLVGQHQWDPTRGIDQWLKVDENGQLIVIAPPSIPGLPAEFEPYKDQIAKHFGLLVKDIAKIDKIEWGTVCLGSGCPAWAIAVELTAIVNGEEKILSGMVNGPARDLPVIFEPMPVESKIPTSAYGAGEEQKTVKTASASEDLPAVRRFDLGRGSAPIARAKSSLRSIARMPVMSSSSLQRNVMDAGTVTSSKGLRVFGFEQNNALFGDLMSELTR